MFLLLFSYVNINDAKTKYVIQKHNYNIDLILTTIIEVESQNENVAGSTGDIGYLQETKIYVDDVNRILGYNKYKYIDRWNKYKSIEMYYIYQKHYNYNYDFKLACLLHHRSTDSLEQLRYFNKCKIIAMQVILTNASPEHRSMIMNYISDKKKPNHQIIKIETKQLKTDISYINSPNLLSISLSPTLVNIPDSIGKLLKYLI